MNWMINVIGNVVSFEGIVIYMKYSLENMETLSQNISIDEKICVIVFVRRQN